MYFLKVLGMEVADAAAETVDTNKNEQKSTLTGVIQLAITLICKFKDKVVKLITKRRFRRSIKLFLENQKGFWDTLVNFWTTVKNNFAALGNWVSKTWEQLITFTTSLVESWKGHYEQFIEKCRALYKKFNEIYTVVKACYDTLKNGIKKVKDFFAKVFERTAEIGRIAAGDPTAVAGFFVNLMCQFEIFREAINSLVDAMTITYVLAKYELYGKFAGASIRILIGFTD